MNIIPISKTQIDWPMFIRGCQDYMDVTPTKTVDESGKSLDKLESFTASLDYANLNNCHGIYGQVSYGFILDTTSDIMFRISTVTRLNLVYKNVDRNISVAIYNGTLAQWRDACVYFCREDMDKELLNLFYALTIFFEREGFKNLFHGYKKKRLKFRGEEYFVLEPK